MSLSLTSYPSNVLFIYSSVTCAMQVMLGTQSATFTSALKDTVKRRHLFIYFFSFSHRRDCSRGSNRLSQRMLLPITSSIYKHYSNEHNTAVPDNFSARFNVIKKCTNKFDCLVNEMLCIQDLKPTLNVQSDSLRAKVFV